VGKSRLRFSSFGEPKGEKDGRKNRIKRKACVTRGGVKEKKPAAEKGVFSAAFEKIEKEVGSGELYSFSPEKDKGEKLLAELGKKMAAFDTLVSSDPLKALEITPEDLALGLMVCKEHDFQAVLQKDVKEGEYPITVNSCLMKIKNKSKLLAEKVASGNLGLEIGYKTARGLIKSFRGDKSIFWRKSSGASVSIDHLLANLAKEVYPGCRNEFEVASCL